MLTQYFGLASRSPPGREAELSASKQARLPLPHAISIKIMGCGEGAAKFYVIFIMSYAGFYKTLGGLKLKMKPSFFAV